jgi:hypothetical protein
MNVRMVKLVTGDEIIAEYEIDVDEGTCTLKNPVKLGMDPQSGALKFMGYPMDAKQPVEIVLPCTDILFYVPVNEDCENAYKEAFGGIIESKSELII